MTDNLKILIVDNKDAYRIFFSKVVVVQIIVESWDCFAVEGKYDNLSINRGLQPECLDRFFHKSNGNWIVEDRVKRMVTFQQYNLKQPMTNNEAFDVVFLRNVMIHFPDGLKRELFETMATILVPNGFLFLGTGETVSGYTTRFEILEWQKAAFYRVK